MRKELVANIAEVTQSDQAIARLRAELSGIDESIARRSAPTDLLDDPEDREEELTALRAYRLEVVEKLRIEANGAPNRLTGVELKQALEHLQFVAANLLKHNRERRANRMAGWRITSLTLTASDFPPERCQHGGEVAALPVLLSSAAGAASFPALGDGADGLHPPHR